MVEDFLNRVSKKASEQLKNLKSPYQFETERTRTVQPCMSTYKEVKHIAFESDEKTVDVLEKITREGFAKRGQD